MRFSCLLDCCEFSANRGLEAWLCAKGDDLKALLDSFSIELNANKKITKALQRGALCLAQWALDNCLPVEKPIWHGLE